MASTVASAPDIVPDIAGRGRKVARRPPPGRPAACTFLACGMCSPARSSRPAVCWSPAVCPSCATRSPSSGPCARPGCRPAARSCAGWPSPRWLSASPPCSLRAGSPPHSSPRPTCSSPRSSHWPGTAAASWGRAAASAARTPLPTRAHLVLTAALAATAAAVALSPPGRRVERAGRRADRAAARVRRPAGRPRLPRPRRPAHRPPPPPSAACRRGEPDARRRRRRGGGHRAPGRARAGPAAQPRADPAGPARARGGARAGGGGRARTHLPARCRSASSRAWCPRPEPATSRATDVVGTALDDTPAQVRGDRGGSADAAGVPVQWVQRVPGLLGGAVLGRGRRARGGPGSPWSPRGRRRRA